MSGGSPEYFLLRPEVEKAYGYSHAVKIGDDIKISGAVSMDDEGNPTAVGDLEQQMKNAYSDLDTILKHYGCSFDDVVVENIFATDMAKFLEVASYRTSIYTKDFPTGTWLEVKGLALPEFMIEIELEAHRSEIK
jgi:enamine deaminase RidA (YjgF/YER057c/UK114 family)